MVRRGSCVVGMVLGALLATGCSSSDDPLSEQTKAPTPIAKLDAGSLRLARAEFCDRLPGAAVRDALGGDSETDDAWSNGDPMPEDPDGEVAQEFGCAWGSSDGTRATAWVFATPVTAPFAATIVKRVGEGPDCTGYAATVFGDPGMLQVCFLPDGLVEMRRAGLFGDTWLTCEVTLRRSTADRVEADKAHRQRLDAWCAQVVAALDLSAGD